MHTAKQPTDTSAQVLHPRFLLVADDVFYLAAVVPNLVHQLSHGSTARAADMEAAHARHHDVRT
jgi:hypothetical protein